MNDRDARGVGHETTSSSLKPDGGKLSTSDPIDEHRNIASPTVNERKRELKHSIRDLREQERLTRKRGLDEHAEKYRKAANALENAVAMLEEWK